MLDNILHKNKGETPKWWAPAGALYNGALYIEVQGGSLQWWAPAGALNIKIKLK